MNRENSTRKLMGWQQSAHNPANLKYVPAVQRNASCIFATSRASGRKDHDARLFLDHSEIAPRLAGLNTATAPYCPTPHQPPRLSHGNRRRGRTKAPKTKQMPDQTAPTTTGA